MKLCFKNTSNWKDPYALLFNNGQKISERIDLLKDENQLFTFEFDNNVYDHFC